MQKSVIDTPPIYPKPLNQGDRIAIVSPAGSIESKHVHAAVEVLEQEGWRPYVGDHALGKFGTYSGSDTERFHDLSRALSDPTVRAVICSRGGYGAIHLLERLDAIPIDKDPKWIVGFSDISALHALMAHKGIVSVHAPMTKDIALGAENSDIACLFDILRGNKPVHKFPTSQFDRPGIATGRLLGGNLAVIAELIGTPFDVIQPGSILFIEDVEEPIYKTERILYQLRLSGKLSSLAGLIVGQFTGYKPNDNYTQMEDMISDMVYPYDFPVAMNVPFGHVEHNIPLLSGARATLRVTIGDTNSLVTW